MVSCPVCNQQVDISIINEHMDNKCTPPANIGIGNHKSSKNTSPNKSPLKKIVITAKNDFFTPKLETSSNTSQSIQSPFPDKREKRFFERSISSSSNRPNKQIKTSNTKVDTVPLAARVRPNGFEEFIGQKELVGINGWLKELILRDKVPSMIMWGPSGVGKTTLARIIAKLTRSFFKEFSGITHAFDEAKNEQKLTGKRTIIFLDEIHRFNKAQQDLFLPYVESGGVTLIGATTENPSFKINSSLLSRCKVFTLNKLTTDEVKSILKRAIDEIRKQNIQNSQSEESNTTLSENDDDNKVDEDALQCLAVMSDGDARIALNALEIALNMKSKKRITKDDIKNVFQKSPLYDKDGEEHYNIISALHKTSLYWLGRMLTGGEDPLYVARRLIVFASEDVGLADNSALPLAIATYQACQFIGMPECEINLAHCVTYLAEAKKSVRSYKAYGLVKETINEEYNHPVPHQLRNAPTKLMKKLGYGAGYKYNPDYKGSVHQEYLPKELNRKVFLDVFKPEKRDYVRPKEQNAEVEIKVEMENYKEIDFNYPFDEFGESSGTHNYDITDNQ
ncbi:MgsA AAA+ ATPase C terminal-domain-containing protein [Glomus cerebriforme]|uniref:MgsA AAA+ ATPase C terminal-domain-containing protein n=1 Tax=Glomus cerebriforme TaxID=658196 RepID=A0A397TGG5_9GLOM|nr:MgsA AAA+ ATPase C terminal-domain-containing protein [Glomus cerebriforme]